MNIFRLRTDWLPLGVVVAFMIGLPLAFLISSLELSGGAEIMPIAMSIIMIVTALASLGARLRRPALPGPCVPARKAPGVGAALLLFPAAAPLMGFYTASWLYVTAGFLLFSGRASLRTAVWGMLTATVFCICAWGLFYHVFTIQTPRGLLY